MRIFRKNAVWKAFLGVTVLLLLTIEVSAAIYCNGCGRIVPPPPPPEEESVSVMPVEFYVVKSAGFFLKSCSDFLLFLNKAEMAEIEGPDYDALNLNLGNAIANMELAMDTYVQLKQQADLTPYDPSVLDKLVKFNYSTFQKENQLLKPVFDEVEYYLKNGAVRELFGELHCQMDEILTVAYTIRTKVEVSEFPEVASLWDLQQKCCKSMLFGQYASRVFYNLEE